MQYWKKTAKYFLYGIAGIGKSELAKAYAKTYRKEYTNILYLMYSGNLRQDIIDLDFADDLPEDTEASKKRIARERRKDQPTRQKEKFHDHER